MPERIKDGNDENLKCVLKNISLFRGLSDNEIQQCLSCSGAESMIYHKGEMIFSAWDKSLKIPVLINGSVTLERYLNDGNRNIVRVIKEAGDVFGYELLISGENRCGLFAQARIKSQVLMLPSKFLTGTCEKDCVFHSKLISNLMLMIAQRTISLNERLEIMMCSSLRQRIIKYLLLEYRREHSDDDAGTERMNTVTLNMNRQELADFLNAARPSVSREMMRMQSEGLISISGRTVDIHDIHVLESII